MDAEAVWQAFAETGEPLLYLLYKSADKSRGKDQTTRQRRGDTAPTAQA